ncbi:ornithine cyclodeaminase [Sphingopyxis bauzanensis]|uniref:Ornithine cyclodeaminase n=1 Tax=Sphingopyxis bauzanensis TaxID=651663 RepID=A0A246K1Z1_9SPHN|nr:MULTISPECIES: ornithine cyclodeaminase family protein [Sphingopyxis]MBA4306412.1 ornithine cyclodeaminase [Sphingopyxis sp.]OHD01935.1 MAG: hypothetical protein A2885_05380 [Sphingopyxis sp. RIFCSPHIGHO2_01_FULL_65_24]OWQ98987.1 ornithine cyclodeaminase [Sphingopyxis bauzanensis]GGJ65021.1 ornithine cyclodeaminase [Sphingopyxis bauzanensis]
MKLLDDRQILALALPDELIDAIEHAFASPFGAPQRMHCHLPGDDNATLLIMPAWQSRSELGVKIATVVPDNSVKGLPTINGIYLLLDGDTGIPQAILDAPALTALRTAAVSAVASRHLSRPDAQSLLLVGTGALIPHLARAHAAVRPLERIMIWGRNPDKARRAADMLSGVADRIEAVSDLARHVAKADIISCATLSRVPLVEADWVVPGTHIDLVGSFAPDMREADSDLFARGRLVVDTQTALRESGDLIEPLRRGHIADPAVDLAALLGDARLGRRHDADITIFKSVGTGLADIAAARYLLAKSEAANRTMEVQA